MTGYTVHTGASKKFVSGWDKIFGEAEKASGKKAVKRKTAKKSGKKQTAKKKRSK